MREEWTENTGLLVGLSSNLVAGVILAIATQFDVETLVLAVVLLVQGVALTTLIFETRRLRYLVQEKERGRRETQAISTVVDDVVRSLQRYGVIDSASEERSWRNDLLGSTYLRGQGFYYLLRSGFLELHEQLRYINDHPFKPFSEALYSLRRPGVQHVGIGAVPDELYETEDIENRIAFARAAEVTYHLLPAPDVHLSMLIFDSRVALIYATPENRTACSFSEALLVTSAPAVQSLSRVYDRLLNLAQRRVREIGMTAEVELSQILRSRRPMEELPAPPTMKRRRRR